MAETYAAGDSHRESQSGQAADMFARMGLGSRLEGVAPVAGVAGRLPGGYKQASDFATNSLWEAYQASQGKRTTAMLASMGLGSTLDQARTAASGVGSMRGAAVNAAGSAAISRMLASMGLGSTLDQARTAGSVMGSLNAYAGWHGLFKNPAEGAVTEAMRRQTGDLLRSLAGGGPRGSVTRVSGLRGYAQVREELCVDLGIQPTDQADFVPFEDDALFENIEKHSPQVAQAIEQAAKRVTTALWSQRVVRNSLALAVASAVVVLYCASGFLPPEWRWLTGIVSALGIPNARTAYKKIAAPSEDDE